MRRAGAPFRFASGVIALWLVGRGAWLVHEQDLAAEARSGKMQVSSRPAPGDGQGALIVMRESDTRAQRLPYLMASASPASIPAQAQAQAMTMIPAPAHDERRPAPALARPVADGAMVPVWRPVEMPRSTGRVAGSAWLLARAGRGHGLASGGQLGASQLGIRIERPVGATFSAMARLSRPLEDQGGEAAVGLAWRPRNHGPVTLAFAFERRIALEPAGRDAFAAFASAGLWRPDLPGGVLLDGYAQAGMVGLRRRDAFVDGALRLARPLGRNGDGLRVGMGLWGGAQPGAARLDIGPHLAVPVEVAGARVGIALDARLRIAGRAAPGSGVALTLSSDF